MSSGYKPFTDEKSGNPIVTPRNKKKVDLENQESSYDLYKIPPDFQLCDDHFKAKSVGIDDKDNDIFCGCCQIRKAKTSIKLCSSVKDLSYLGPGYPLFFLFIKYCIIILSLLFLVSGVFGVYQNMGGNYCLDPKQATLEKTGKTSVWKADFGECLLSTATKFSLANLVNDGEKVELQHWMNFLAAFFIILGLQIFRKSQRKLAKECDERDTSANDYAVCVENIPIDDKIDYHKELKEFFQNFKSKSGDKLEVVKIDLAFELTKLTKLQQERQKVLIECKKSFIQQIDTGKFPEGITEEILKNKIKTEEEKILKFQDELSKELKNADNKETKFTGTAFVTFQYEAHKNVVCKEFKMGGWDKLKTSFTQSGKSIGPCSFHGARLLIKAAADPTDVYWENLHLSRKERFLRQMFGYFITLLLLAGCSFLIYLLNAYQKDVQNEAIDSSLKKVKKEKKKGEIDTGELEIKLIGIAISIGIVVVNKVLAFVIPLVVNFEKNKTRTDSDSSIAQKLSFALFLNTGFMNYLLAHIIVKHYYGNGGLVSNTFTIFFSNAFLNPVLTMVNFGYLITLAKRWFQRRKGDAKCKLYQIEANKLYENPAFPVPTTYAAFINTVWFTIFYAPILPLGTIVSILGLFCSYWALKFTLLRRTTVSNDLSDELTEEMTDFLEISLVVYGVANVIFHILMFQTDSEPIPFSIPAWLTFALAIIHFILPTEKINKMLFKLVDSEEVKKYADVEDDLETDYSKENPATKEDAIRDDREKKKKKRDQEKFSQKVDIKN